MKYEKWTYLYPPRPETALVTDKLPDLEKEGWWAQFKKNGTCSVFGIGPNKEFHAMTRHKEEHKAWKPSQQLKDALAAMLPKDSWTVLVGEVMHSKTKMIKDTVFIHDIIVFESQHLTSNTFAERQEILEKLLPAVDEDYSHFIVAPGIWRAKNFKTDFAKLYLGIEDQDVDEGLVLKNPSIKLRWCLKPDSNKHWQMKVRYGTKKYTF